jgi:hypothetical protein
MKKLIVLLSVMSILLFTSGTVSALLVEGNEVGSVDTFVGAAVLGNSGEATELAWVKTFFPSATLDDYTVFDKSEYVMYSENGIGAFELQNAPLYYFLKIGTGNDVINEGTPGESAAPDHIMFANVVDMHWAAFYLSYYSEEDVQLYFIRNVGAVSHVGEGGQGEGTPVPEPYTLLLLGLGLMGVAGVRKFRK